MALQNTYAVIHPARSAIGGMCAAAVGTAPDEFNRLLTNAVSDLPAVDEHPWLNGAGASALRRTKPGSPAS